MIRAACLLLSAFLLGCLPAAAASSEWVEAEGGRVRLVTSGKPAPDGSLRGALQIDLRPGWKTYWRDPGAVGVPPALALETSSGPARVLMDFPVPIRFEEGDSISTGYDASTAFALTIHLPAEAEPGPMKAELFLGLCETICIPLQAQLTLDPSKDADDFFHRAVVEDAFRSLPKPAEHAFGVIEGIIDEDSLTVTVEASEGEPKLFLDGGGAWQFGKPESAGNGETLIAPIIARPKAASLPPLISYTLQSGDAAVSGSFQPRAQ